MPVYAAGMLFRVFMVLQLFWVYARGVAKTKGWQRHRDNGRVMRAGAKQTWSSLVLRDLQSGYLRPPGITDENVLDARSWNCCTEHLDCMVIGLVLAEPWKSLSMMDVLGERDRVLKDYYDLKWRLDGDLFKFRVVETIALQKPQTAWLENSVGASPRSMIFRMSVHSARSCLQCPTLHDGDDNTPLIDILNVWRERHNIGPEDPVVAMSMPIPHALLITSGSWSSYLAPYLWSGRKSQALGWRRVPDFVSDIAIRRFDDDEWMQAPMQSLSPAFFQDQNTKKAKLKNN